MKKVMLTAFAAMAMVAMVACNNNSKPAEVADDTTAATVADEGHKCAHEGDTAMCCKAEGMAQEGESCCQKAEGQKCCKAEGQGCPNQAAE